MILFYRKCNINLTFIIYEWEEASNIQIEFTQNILKFISDLEKMIMDTY